MSTWLHWKLNTALNKTRKSQEKKENYTKKIKTTIVYPPSYQSNKMCMNISFLNPQQACLATDHLNYDAQAAESNF